MSSSSTSEADPEEGVSDDSPWEISSDSSKGTFVRDTAQDNQREFTTAGIAKLTESLSGPSKSIMNLGRVPTSEMPRLLESMRFAINCLYRLPIRKPAPLDRLRTETSLDYSSYQHFDVLYVMDKFPHVHPDLAARLGKFITRRRQILYYREAHKLNLDTSRVQPTKSVPEPALTSSVKEDGQEIGPRAAGNHAATSQSVFSQTPSSHFTLRSKATTLRLSDYPITAIGGHMDPTNLDASSVAESKSSMASSYTGKDIRIDVPPRPKDEKGHEREWFECPYCLITRNITTERRWK